MDRSTEREATGTDSPVSPLTGRLPKSETAIVSTATTSPAEKFSFLVLAPAQSSAYPVSSPVKDSTTAATDPGAPSPLGSKALPSPEIAPTLKSRRSSSVSSSASASQRFLKLGPVYFGGEPGVDDLAEDEE